MTHPPTILTVSAHADDETLGAGGALTMLVRSGATMLNLACTIGHIEDLSRRRAELAEAGNRLGFTNVEMKPLAAIGQGDNLRMAAAQIADAVDTMIETHGPDIVVSPHLHDCHHGHEAVAAGVRLALERSTNGPVWWQYGIWADLARPTTYVPFGEDVMGDVAHTIAAYTGENGRSAYDRMYPARAVVFRTLGSERIFGFGTASASDLPYADLLTEVRHTPTGWQIAAPRAFTLDEPVASRWVDRDVTWWLDTPSMRERWGRPA